MQLMYYFKIPLLRLLNPKRGNYNEQGKFLPWVMRISHNLLLIILEKIVEFQSSRVRMSLTYFQLSQMIV